MPVLNTPIIIYNILLLAHFGIKKIGINLHHLGPQIQSFLGTGEQFGVELHYSHEEEILGTGGGVKYAEDFFSEPTIIINGDVIIDLDIQKLIDAHETTQSIATMVLRKDPKQDEFGTLGLSTQNQVIRILDKSISGQEHAAYMFSGAQIVEPGFLKFLPEKTPACIVRHGYQHLLDLNTAFHGFIHQGCWADTGTPERYLKIQYELLQKEQTLHFAEALVNHHQENIRAYFPYLKRKDGHLLIAPNAQISSSATLKGCCIIGPNTTIEDNATLENVVLLEDAIVKEKTSIKNALVDAYDIKTVSQVH